MTEVEDLELGRDGHTLLKYWFELIGICDGEMEGSTVALRGRAEKAVCGSRVRLAVAVRRLVELRGLGFVEEERFVDPARREPVVEAGGVVGG